MRTELKREAYEANVALPRHGLINLTFGNASAIDRRRGIFAIKPSGVAYEDLRPADMVLVDIVARRKLPVAVFTLDTGRLHQETYDLMTEVNRRYGVRIEIVLPDSREVEAMTSRHGPNLFYDGVPQRMACCEIRKVRPLDRKLRTLQAWITGLRRSQNDTRAQVR